MGAARTPLGRRTGWSGECRRQLRVERLHFPAFPALMIVVVYPRTGHMRDSAKCPSPKAPHLGVPLGRQQRTSLRLYDIHPKKGNGSHSGH